MNADTPPDWGDSSNDEAAPTHSGHGGTPVAHPIGVTEPSCGSAERAKGEGTSLTSSQRALAGSTAGAGAHGQSSYRKSPCK